MLSFQCNNCGGEMSVSRIGELECPYCGSRNFFNDSQLVEYKAFRLRMLECLSALAQSEEWEASTARLWSNSETEVFCDKDGMDITIEYIYKSIKDDIHIYSARKNVIFIYPKDKKILAECGIKAFSGITFPQADMRGLSKCFPSLMGKFELKDGRYMVVCSKSENMYPVEMFGALPAKHVEWIISRLENIACVMEFNDMVHGGISPETVFINPKTHEASLLGGWHRAIEKRSYDNSDLHDIRDTAKKLLGKDYGDAPKPLIKFIKSRPAKDAYEDFGVWDDVIEKELGGRHFTEFKL